MGRTVIGLARGFALLGVAWVLVFTVPAAIVGTGIMFFLLIFVGVPLALLAEVSAPRRRAPASVPRPRERAVTAASATEPPTAAASTEATWAACGEVVPAARRCRRCAADL